jgi:GR25 family glycosyltransferase involved in LPS biosynthesis
MKLCYNIFHIENLGQSSNIRKQLSNQVVSALYGVVDRIPTHPVLINNQELYDNFVNNVFDLKPHFEFKFGEMGVWASNIVAINEFIKSDYDVLMLMEDDIQINNNFYELLSDYLNTIPEDWDVFSYFVHPNQFDRYTDIRSNDEIVLAYQDWSMLCWLITKPAAKKLIEDISKNGINMPIDWYIFRQPEKFKSYSLSPTARRGCELYDTVSTFQQIDDRIKINGIL